MRKEFFLYVINSGRKIFGPYWLESFYLAENNQMNTAVPILKLTFAANFALI